MANIKVGDLPINSNPNIEDYTINDKLDATETTKTKWAVIRSLLNGWNYCGEKLFSDWQPNATNSGDISLMSVPEGYTINSIAYIISELFAGGGNVRVNLQIKNSIDLAVFPMVQIDLNINTLAADQGNYVFLASLFDKVNPFNVVGRLNTLDDTIDALTQGKIKVWVKISKLPTT